MLAAIEALIDEQDYLANYHLAWYAVTHRRGGSRVRCLNRCPAP